MEKEVLQSKTISYIRFPLTLGVIFIHFNLVNGVSIGGGNFGDDFPGWYNRIITLFSDVLPRISVPLFFVISGYLFFYKCDFDKNTYFRKLKTRLHTLLVPYIIWNIIAVCFVLCRCVISKEPYDINISIGRIFNTFFNDVNNNGIIIRHLTTVKEMPEPSCAVLWYVREIMLMAIISPLIFLIVKKIGPWLLFMLGGLWVFDSVLLPTSMHYFISAFFFYTVGAHFSIMKLNMVTVFSKLKYLPMLYLIIAIFDTCTKSSEYNIFLHNIGVIIGLISSIIIASYLVDNQKVEVNMKLSNSSFFIYVLHSFIIVYVGNWLFKLAHIPENPYVMIFFYFFIPCFVAFVCYIIYSFIKKYLPHICGVLTGGR